MVLEQELAQCLTQAHHSEHNGYYYFSLRKLFEITHGGCWPFPLAQKPRLSVLTGLVHCLPLTLGFQNQAVHHS